MKKISQLMGLAFLMVMLAACGGKKVEDVTAKKFIAQAEEIITLINQGNYEDVYAQFDENMEGLLSVEEMEEFTPIIEESGSFKEIEKASIEEKDGYYVTVSVAKYSNKSRVFTISFNDQAEVSGLFIK